jgi:hypothetical protein
MRNTVPRKLTGVFRRKSRSPQPSVEPSAAAVSLDAQVEESLVPASVPSGEGTPETRGRIRRGRIVVILLLVGLIAFALPSLAPPVGNGIIVGTNVVFRPSESWTDISFSSAQTFLSEVIVGPTAVIFDNVGFDARKVPPGPPRAGILITTWTPGAENGTTAIQFTAQSDSNATLLFNITGLRQNVSYEVYVDGTLTMTANATAAVSFSQSAWPSRTFVIQASAGTSPPEPPPPPPPDTTSPGQVTDLRITAWGTNNAVLQWTAPGDNGTTGQATVYEVRYNTTPVESMSDFMNATIIPTGVPQPAGATETLNVTGLAPDTMYWFALRTSDNKSNWSPLSNIAEVRTLTTLAGLPTVDSVSLNLTQGQLEVSFSEPMNRTSVEQSLTVSPEVPLQVKWSSDMKLQIVFAQTLDSNTTYFLSIAPIASDEGGSPMAKTFTFRFGGLAGRPLPGTSGQSWDLALPILAGFIGLGVVTLTIFGRSVRDHRKAERMQRAIAVLSNRFAALSISTRVRDLREWILSSRSARPPTVTLQKPRK